MFEAINFHPHGKAISLDFTDVIVQSYSWGDKKVHYLPAANFKVIELWHQMARQICDRHIHDSQQDFPEFKCGYLWSPRSVPKPILDRIIELFLKIYEINLVPVDNNSVPASLISVDGCRVPLQSVSGWQVSWSPTNPHLYRSVDSKKTSIASITVPFKEHYQDLLDDRKSGKFTDVTFIVGERTFKAHRLIIALRSEVLGTMLTGKMKEGSAKEVAIEADPEAFELSLDYIYEGKIPGNRSVIAYYKLRDLAHQNMMEKLQAITSGMIKQVIEKIVVTKDNFAELFQVVKEYGAPDLLDKCLNFVRSNKNYEDLHAQLTGGDYQVLLDHLLGKRVLEIEPPPAKAPRTDPKDKQE